MTPATVLKKFNHTIAIWEKELGRYTFQQLCARPDAESWSMGEVYLHMIDTALDFNMKQIDICLAGNENENACKSAEGEELFARNAFSATKIFFSSEARKPKSKEQIRRELQHIKKLMKEYERKISNSLFRGKTKHPGLHFLDAGEWFQFIEMHFRHHLRQKKRIDAYLNSIK